MSQRRRDRISTESQVCLALKTVLSSSHLGASQANRQLQSTSSVPGSGAVLGLQRQTCLFPVSSKWTSRQDRLLTQCARTREEGMTESALGLARRLGPGHRAGRGSAFLRDRANPRHAGVAEYLGNDLRDRQGVPWPCSLTADSHSSWPAH